MIPWFLLAAAVATASGPTCELPDSTVVSLELALTDQERILGLMFRDTLPPSSGMLFIFERDDYLPFWMKDTLIALDFIWLDKQGRVVDLRPNVPPCKLDPCPSYKPSKPARAMLEVPAGTAAAHGVKPGSVLKCLGVPGFPVEPLEKE